MNRQSTISRFLAIAALLAAAPSAAQPTGGIEGVWNTGSNGGRVQIYRCGTALCGKVTDGAPLRANPDLRDTRNPDPSLRSRRIMGLVTLRGFAGGPPRWTGGSVYNPENGQGASTAYLTLRSDGKLEVKGCKASIFCQTKIWTRA